MNLRATVATRSCRHLRRLLPPFLLPKVTTIRRIHRVYPIPARMLVLQHSLHYRRASCQVYQQSTHSKLYIKRRLSELATSGQTRIKTAKHRHSRPGHLLNGLLRLIINPHLKATLGQRLATDKTSSGLPTNHQLIPRHNLTPHRTGTNNHQAKLRIFLHPGHSWPLISNPSKIRTFCRHWYRVTGHKNSHTSPLITHIQLFLA